MGVNNVGDPSNPVKPQESLPQRSEAGEVHKVDRIAEPWGTRTPYASGEPWPVRVDSYLEDGISEEGVDRWVQSASLLHSNGDAMDIAVKDGRIVGVRGHVPSRVNHGRLDPKDLFGWQANNSPDRLKRPLVREGGRLVETDWDTAMGRIVERSQWLLEEAGPSSLGFYTTGQLFLEDYYTLGIIARAGIGTNHLDGNTRLCTATAGESLKESFGCDGQPGSFADIDHADTIVMYGHNMAETQAVTWMRVLDRRRGPNPPKLITVDPRLTPVAEEADLHLRPKNGTNLALLNALVHEIISNDWVDHEYIQAHTVGFGELQELTQECTPEWAAGICGVPAEEIREAARMIGESERLFQTVLQGVYQSHQATASACQVNNINLIRGMIGKPGCSVLQMNGQPTAQNTRETGCNGDLPGFRNWQNDAHVQDLARIWNVEPLTIPHYSEPTHAMQIFRYAEEGTIKFLWIQCTNPAVSLPELHRIRSILEQERLFVVVQDIFLTETAQLADVVLPAAAWGEKTGTYTNADRTVHLSEKAIEPPGEARSDFDIFLDYAERMGFEDKDGQPLIKWQNAESAFEAWKECSRDRPCDYSGITYEKLMGASGIQWPCNEEHPDGTERLYEDGKFWASPDYCESYGKDLLTGASWEPTEYMATNPSGKALLKAAEYVPPYENPNEEYPLLLNTGRTIYHFHTRTRTARAPQLQEAAPEVWAELSASDAASLGVGEGDLLEISSPRASIRARARISGIREGVVFVPFHYGYWDEPEGDTPDGHARAANELTITQWDAASKQPIYKTAAARVTKVEDSGGRVAPAPTNTGSRPVRDVGFRTAGGASALVTEKIEGVPER
jgi:anaerobic selenocysteine-containing dehydrogenase